MNVETLLQRMSEGVPQRAEDVRAFVEGVVAGEVSDAQAAAWLAWAFARGLTADETRVYLQAMCDTGEQLAWPEGPTCVDKHSTGGVGDKVSLVLAPLWAELGLRVPMISGRGLQHTGGTLDKLEAIEGYRTDLEADALATVLDEVGAFISGQTPHLAPADRRLYAIRDEVQAVASIPLIVASILSKKRAAGVERLILDVKVGSGAFMQTPARAQALAEALVRSAADVGLRASARLTDMDVPNGRAIGNALEVAEAVACLQGEGPDDLRDLVLALADHPDAAAVLDSGAAWPRFQAMVAAQSGSLSALDRLVDTPAAGTETHVVVADRAGHLSVDALGCGRASFALGAGRRHADEAVDPAVGVVLEVAHGEAVAPGQPLARVHHRDGRGLDQALATLSRALRVGDAPSARALIRGRVDAPPA